MIIHNIENWMLPKKAFEWIFENIKEGSTILEFGSGFGTEVLSKKYKMISIEQDEEWIGKFDSEYIYSPVENGFYKLENLNLPKKYDLLIIDGPTQSSGGRKGFLKNMNIFYLDCYILIDDVHRTEEMEVLIEISSKLNREYKIFDCGNKKFGIIL